MIPLFKKRNFSDYISDTFDFFRKDGKHFLTSYFTVNGVFLLLLAVFIYFISDIYFEFAFSKISNPNPDFNYIENFFDENFGLMILGGAVFVILIFFLTLLNFSFPIVYLQEYDKNDGSNFTTKNIISGLKSNFGKILIFFFISLFLLTPIIMILFIILIFLSFIIVGIPLFIITIPTIFSLMSLTLFHYLNTNDGFFGSLGKAFQYIFKQFWATIGSTMIVYLIIQVTMTILSMIPYIIAIIIMFTSAETGSASSQNDTISGLGIIMTVLFVFTTIFHYIFNNLLMINQGMIYYSRREHAENKTSFNEIDSIGTHFE